MVGGVWHSFLFGRVCEHHTSHVHFSHALIHMRAHALALVWVRTHSIHACVICCV